MWLRWKERAQRESESAVVVALVQIVAVYSFAMSKHFGKTAECEARRDDLDEQRYHLCLNCPFEVVVVRVKEAFRVAAGRSPLCIVFGRVYSARVERSTAFQVIFGQQ